jgi:hypothetical protein
VSADERTEAVLDLVELRVPVDQAIEALKSFDWDHQADLAVLTTADARRGLDAFLDGRLDPVALERWADAIESREDVGVDPDSSEELTRLIFELANPLICRPLDHSVAEEWLARLTG